MSNITFGSLRLDDTIYILVEGTSEIFPATVISISKTNLHYTDGVKIQYESSGCGKLCVINVNSKETKQEVTIQMPNLNSSDDKPRKATVATNVNLLQEDRKKIREIKIKEKERAIKHNIRVLRRISRESYTDLYQKIFQWFNEIDTEESISETKTNTLKVE